MVNANICKLAGFTTAIAFESVFSGGNFIPIHSYADAEGNCKFQFVQGETAQESVDLCEKYLEENPSNAAGSTVVFVSLVTIDGESLEGLTIQFRAFEDEHNGVIELFFPYSGSSESDDFFIHPIRVHAAPEAVVNAIPTILDKFFEGLLEREEGAKILEAHYKK